MTTNYDVIIVGGGTTGVCAAISAARNGMKCAIIELNGFLGGNASNGLPWLGFHSTDGEQVVGGIAMEIITRLKNIGGASEFVSDPICGSAVQSNSTLLKLVLAQMVKESNIDVFLHTMVSGYNDEKCKVNITSKEGSRELYAKVVIDCTDSADAAVSAGANFVFGRQSDNMPQVASLLVRFGNVDMEQLCAYLSTHRDQIRPLKLSEKQINDYAEKVKTAPVFVLGAFPELIKKASHDNIGYQRDRLIGVADREHNELILVCSRTENVNPNDTLNYSEAEFDALLQTTSVMKLLNGYIPGCEHAYPIASGHSIGIRETRHVKCLHNLTADELMSGTRFDDAIACGAYHLDVHNPDDNGLSTKFPPKYQIPYSCMIPDGLKHTIIAGRCVGASQEAQASIRVIPILAAMGEAAGCAAAVSIKSEKNPAEISITELQQRLTLQKSLF